VNAANLAFRLLSAARSAPALLLVAVGVAQAGVPPTLEVSMLVPSANVDVESVTGGAADAGFVAYDYRAARRAGTAFWVRLVPSGAWAPDGTAVVAALKGRHLGVDLYARGDSAVAAVPLATTSGAFRGRHAALYVLPRPVASGDVLYARVAATGRGAEELSFSLATLEQALADASARARAIAFAFGALIAVSLAGFLIWFVLEDRLFMLYAGLFSLQALYIAFLSGQGFDWPVLSAATPLTSHAWNVPAALSGAIACLFVREIADLRRFSPRVYRAYGWLSVAFVVLAGANAAREFGFGAVVNAVGNLMFAGTALFTLVVAFLAWRRGSRPAGWFLIAWILLEAFTIATALTLLTGRGERGEWLLYYALPASMVAAAILIALGVADRLREQRLALSQAERHAQTDPLTGVLNRRSLIERLDAACVRAQARGLPIALLFIDLDHFKQINDTYGHPAGDACLAAVVAPIQSELRQSDVIGRYGGEEFIVLLSSADSAAAQLIAERIRARVAAVRVTGFGEPIRLTCSIGVAASDALEVWGDALLAQADAAVYAAKRAGRDRVQVAAARAA
jgi:diguanylate cyclase (GGDEF)-like protein